MRASFVSHCPTPRVGVPTRRRGVARPPTRMGLFRIQLKPGAAESFSATMIAIGLPVTRIEQRDNGTHYFYDDPESKRESFFWTHAECGDVYWLSGLSSSARKIAEGFASAG